MDILSMVTRVPILVFGVERNDDDFADRINYKYTVAVLVIFAIIVTNRQFGTKQIHCWIPAYFTRNYEEYINDICWVSNTYYISLDQRLPEAEQIRKSFELKYYQWVPFILLSQAFFFYIPHIAWRALSRRSGLDVRDIVEAASNYKSVDKYEHRQKYMSYMLTAVDQYVGDPRRGKETRHRYLIKRLLSSVCFVSGKFLGNYLMVLYLFIKLAFIVNCISQLFVLNLLLGHDFHKFGFELIDKILNGKGWDTGSRIFPKISMCDFRIREVGNPKVSHRYTVQCVLPINLFNQQIFTFIWFWYGIVLFVNIYSLCVWTYRFLPSKRLRYVGRRIEIMRQASFALHKRNKLNFDQPVTVKIADFEKEIIEKFVNDYLESDGLFILRVLASNTSDFVCTELIQELWKYYKIHGKYNKIHEQIEHDDDLTNSDYDYDEESQRLKQQTMITNTTTTNTNTTAANLRLNNINNTNRVNTFNNNNPQLQMNRISNNNNNQNQNNRINSVNNNNNNNNKNGNNNNNSNHLNGSNLKMLTTNNNPATKMNYTNNNNNNNNSNNMVTKATTTNKISNQVNMSLESKEKEELSDNNKSENDDNDDDNDDDEENFEDYENDEDNENEKREHQLKSNNNSVTSNQKSSSDSMHQQQQRKNSNNTTSDMERLRMMRKAQQQQQQQSIGINRQSNQQQQQQMNRIVGKPSDTIINNNNNNNNNNSKPFPPPPPLSQENSLLISMNDATRQPINRRLSEQLTAENANNSNQSSERKNSNASNNNNNNNNNINRTKANKFQANNESQVKQQQQQSESQESSSNSSPILQTNNNNNRSNTDSTQNARNQ